ncbi:MAG: hypothetical protein WAU36_13620 [Cyclobacteriaceae bacterium]
MGVRILTLLVIILLCAMQVQGQVTITHFDIKVTMDGLTNKVMVTEKILFTGDTNDKHITLQSLAFENSNIQSLKGKVNDSIVSLKLSKNENGLLITSIPITTLSSLDITYLTSVEDSRILAPLIFVPASSGSSDEKLFSATITIPAFYKIVESFPTIELDGVQDGAHRIYTIQLPVIPSLVKLDLAPVSEFKMGTTEILDAVIIIILALLGVIGWKKRKMLT